MRKMSTWDEYLIEVLADRDEAIGHLEAILEDYHIFQNPVVIRDTLQIVVRAQGGVSELAKQADMDPQVLSKMISNSDTPLIDALGTVLKALGYQLSIKPGTCENTNLETDALKVESVSAHVAESLTMLQ